MVDIHSKLLYNESVDYLITRVEYTLTHTLKGGHNGHN